MFEAENLPKHMDKWARNQRLYESLLKMGLVVNPIFADDYYTRIDWLQVSVDLPEALPPAGIVFPIEGAKVGDIVTTPVADADNVVEFPTVF